MAKMTLLEIVQDILSDLESDNVNSINDTIEALEVANIVRSTYYNITDGKDWPHLDSLFLMESLSDTSKPNYLKLPNTIAKVEFFKYNNRKATDTFDKFQDITYKNPYAFVNMLQERNSSLSTITQITDFSGVVLNVINNTPPTYFTSFNDVYIVCDSFDSAVDSTLQASKTSCKGKRNVAFSISDSFTPDLPVQAFSYLLNEAKATAFVILKQTANPKAQEHSTLQRRKMSQEKWKIQRGITVPSYGRK